MTSVGFVGLPLLLDASSNPWFDVRMMQKDIQPVLHEVLAR
jgi:hypothetical protein